MVPWVAVTVGGCDEQDWDLAGHVCSPCDEDQGTHTPLTWLGGLVGEGPRGRSWSEAWAEGRTSAPGVWTAGMRGTLPKLVRGVGTAALAWGRYLLGQKVQGWAASRDAPVPSRRRTGESFMPFLSPQVTSMAAPPLPPPDPQFVLRGAQSAVHALHFCEGAQGQGRPLLLSG